MAYTSKLKVNLPIYGIKNKDLREFTTTEKDVDKMISRIPLVLARMYEEDVITEMEMDISLAADELEVMDNYT